MQQNLDESISRKESVKLSYPLTASTSQYYIHLSLSYYTNVRIIQCQTQKLRKQTIIIDVIWTNVKQKKGRSFQLTTYSFWWWSLMIWLTP